MTVCNGGDYVRTTLMVDRIRPGGLNLFSELLGWRGWPPTVRCFLPEVGLPVFPDSARSRRCDGWTRLEVYPSCGASGRRSLGPEKLDRLAHHCAASIGGRRWRGRPRAPSCRIRGVQCKVSNPCDPRQRDC